MPQIPTLPLSAETQTWIDFCIDFRSVQGFIAVQAQFEQEGLEPGQAYEKAEHIYFQLFKCRRYKDREEFYNVRSAYRRKKKK